MSQHPSQESISFLDFVWKYKVLLSFNILAISIFTFSVLYIFNAVPDELRSIDEQPETVLATTTQTSPVASAPLENIGELPQKVIIEKIGVDTVVNNPATTNIDVLNNYLLKGAVRYPGSALLGAGNVFIFGHSTGIKIVHNQAYKTFNNLKDLSRGDEILVQSADQEYVYSVDSVTLVDDDKELVDFSQPTNMLTLSTCDVFGEKQQRFVVQARFVTTRHITTS